MELLCSTAGFSLFLIPVFSVLEVSLNCVNPRSSTNNLLVSQKYN